MRNTFFRKAVIVFVVFLFLGGVGFNLNWSGFNFGQAGNLQFDEQEATIRAIKKVLPAVVSIIVYNEEKNVTIDLGTGQHTVTKEKIKKGSGTGFLISSDGLILTNKHVINSAEDETAGYKIILNNNKQYYAQLIGKDPLNDLAVLRIFDKDLPHVELGDSDNLEIGSTVIAIGNVLGLFQNSVTKGIVSGLGRSLEAGDDNGNSEVINNAIQTDAEINLGNSGGPLVDLNGQVVGINVARALGGGAIGFAIPVNDARPVVSSVIEVGRIKRPWLGVRYFMLTPEIALDRELSRNEGALVLGNNGSPAIVPDSPAAEAGLADGDIIFEINAIKINDKNTLLSVVQKYKTGDRIGLKIQRGDKIIIRIVTLGELK